MKAVEVIVVGRKDSQLTIETHNNESFKLTPLSSIHDGFENIFRTRIEREFLNKPIQVVETKANDGGGGFLGLFKGSSSTAQRFTITLTPVLDYNFIIDRRICGEDQQSEGVILLMRYLILQTLSLSSCDSTTTTAALMHDDEDSEEITIGTIWTMMQNLNQHHLNMIRSCGKELKEEFGNQNLNATQLIILSLCDTFKPDDNLLKELTISKLNEHLIKEKHEQIFAKFKDLANKTWAINFKFTILPLCLYFPNEMKEIVKKKPITNSFDSNDSYRNILTTMKENLGIESKDFLLTALLTCASVFDLVFTIDLFQDIDLSGEEDLLKELVTQKLFKLKIDTIPKVLEAVPSSSILYKYVSDSIKKAITTNYIPQPAQVIFKVFESTEIFNEEEISNYLSTHQVNPNFMLPHFVDHLEHIPLSIEHMKKLFYKLSKPPILLLQVLEKFDTFTTMKTIDKIEDLESLKDILWKTVMENVDEYFNLFGEKKKELSESLFSDFSQRHQKYLSVSQFSPLSIIDKLFYLNSKKVYQPKFDFSYKLLKSSVLTMPSIKRPTKIEEILKEADFWYTLAKFDLKQIGNCDIVVNFILLLRTSYENYFVDGKFTAEQTFKSVEKFKSLSPLYQSYLGNEFKGSLMTQFGLLIENIVHSFHFIRKLIIETGYHEGFGMIDAALEAIPQTRVCDLHNLWGKLLPCKEEIIAISPLQESASFFSYLVGETKLGNVLSSSSSLDWIKSIIKCENSFKKKWLEIVRGDTTIGIIKQIYSFAAVDKKSELNLIEKYLDCQFNMNAKANLEFLEKHFEFSLQAKQLIALFEVFSVSGKFKLALEEYVKLNLEEMLLFEFKKQTQDLSAMVTFNNFNVIRVLSESKDVIDFITENVNEDLRNMINGVEEHSDNFINESTVSDLIDVWSFIRPAILKVNKTETELLDILKKTFLSHNKYANIDAKLFYCSQQIYGLKRLHKNMSNRTELTRETVASLLKEGIPLIYSSSKHSQYSQKNEIFQFKIIRDKAEFLMDDLNDLKSRCLLLSSNEKRDVKTLNSAANANYTSFINLVDKLQTIHQKITELYLAGYPCPMNDQKLPYDILEEQISNLEDTFNSWMKIKQKSRIGFPILNSFHSQQIWQIENSIKMLLTSTIINNEAEEMKLLNILSIINPSITISAVRQAIATLFKSETYVDERLEVLGKLLTFISQKDLDTTDNSSSFIPSGTNIIAVDTKKIIPLVLTVFNGCDCIPTPLNTLICYSNTSMDEMDTFLARAKHFKSLHCIVNAHLLPFTVKDYLIDTIKNYQEKNYLLVIFTDKKNSITDELKNHIRDLKQFDNETLKDFIGTFRPHLEIVISHVSGIGKTEYINCSSFRMKKKPITFPISGNLDRKKLVQRLSRTLLKSYSSLHLDVSIINDQSYDSLDYILFEILILGKLSCGSDIVILPKVAIFMEVANTVNNTLVNSISLRSILNVTDLSIDFDERFIVSTELLSPIQVVCQYLHSLQHNLLVVNDLDLEKLKPLAKEECITLLRTYLTEDKLTSYSSLGVFLKVLAAQLVILSDSLYFKIASLKKMGVDPSIRNELVLALIAVTTEYSSSISALNKVHHLNTDEEAMLKYFKGCLHWEDSNHLLVLFHSINNQTISAVYRDPSQVPESISKLILSQKAFSSIKELPNFESMKRKELLDTLKKICLTSPNDFDDEEYALTPDNILKMILIVTRVKAGIPSLILGETGCGKTSLIKYLAKVIKVNLITKDIHAGITEDDIEQVVIDANSQASPENPVWLFLDEINTCDSVGLISEIVSNNTCQGLPLNSNLSVIAACNPYRLKMHQNSKANIAGLEGKQSISNLAYRVNPLPQSIISYIWDYGSLTDNDEFRYISTIVSSIEFSFTEVTTHALFASHKFIREHEDKSSVSMRDITRFKKLFEYFLNSIISREDPCLEGKPPKHKQILRDYNTKLRQERSDARHAQIRAIILALSHCYYCRLASDKLRESYTITVSNVLNKAVSGISPALFKQVLEEEQKDYVLRMELPLGTALNTSLLENVFVVLVCILNRIPVFVVGKPGCSKSLSIQLINSNIRGDHSKDSMFRKLPQILVVAYQGSESSTAEGIEKVFQKAEKYLEKSNENEKVIPVVLLDEVGLAEISKHNPLKVLHKLLEPEKQLISVVGISNWSLDASKMNRAINLSRPDSTVKDLEQTGLSIMECFIDDVKDHHKIFISQIAKAYHEYIENQSHKNFHGLRDFYSLVKYLSKNGFTNLNLKKGIERNFGGLFSNDMLKRIGSLEVIPNTPVINLITENIKDKNSRHLMVITAGDSALSLLENALSGYEVVFGSKFKDDQSEEYNYRLLSRIILCMESGISLILKDLEQIYGSLYDLLNQNYTIVGNKKNCRIALGAYSNPMCHVHDDFKCIIIVDQKNIDFTDPPFLNRFEKQRLSYHDIFSREQKELKTSITSWLETFVQVESNGEFEIKDAIRCYNSDLIDSLIEKHFGTDNSLVRCQMDLVSLFNLESILRIPYTIGGQDKALSEHLINFYNSLPNQSLFHYLQYCVENKLYLNAITTYSSIHTDIITCITNNTIINEQFIQVYKLGSFNSEKEFQQKLESFFEDPSKSFLFIQCDAYFDSEHILWLKYKINNLFNSASKSPTSLKFIFVILHTHRQVFENESWYFNFMGSWVNLMVDNLEISDSSFKLDTSLDTFTLIQQNIQSIYENIIPWCFNCIRYPANDPKLFKKVQETQNLLLHNEKLQQLFKDLICSKLSIKNQHEDISWRKHVICNKQKMTVNKSAHFAVFDYLCELSREVLAKYIYWIEKYNAFDSILKDNTSDHSKELFELWKILLESTSTDIQLLPSPQRDIYSYSTSIVGTLNFPFSMWINTILESYHPFYCDLIEKANNDENTITFSSLIEPLRTISFSKKKHLEKAVLAHSNLCIKDIITIQANKLGVESSLLVSLMEIMKIDEGGVITNVGEFEHPIDVILFIWFNSKYLISLKEIILTCQVSTSLFGQISSMGELIERISLSLLPTEELLKKITPSEWINKTNIFISQCNSLDLEITCKFTYLKLFNQFIRSLYNLKQEYITNLGMKFYKLVSMCIHEKDDNFNEEEFMQELLDQIPANSMEQKHLNQLIGYLVLRSNVDGLFIHVIEKQKANPLLLSYFETDILLYMQNINVLELLENSYTDNIDSEYKLLSIFETNLSKQLTCNLATFLCNLFHQNADYILESSKIDGKLLDHLYNLAINAKISGVIRLLSFALLKNYIDHAISENIENAPELSCTFNLNSLIQDFKQDSLKEQLAIYFTKRLYSTIVHSFADLISECATNGNWGTKFPFLSKLQWPSQNNIPTQLLIVENYTESYNALNTLIYQRDHSQIYQIINNLFAKKTNNFYSLSVVLLNHIFIPLSNLSSEEIKANKSLREVVDKQVHAGCQKTLLQTLLTGKFKNPQSPLANTSNETNDLIIMIMHIVIVFLSLPECELGDLIRNPTQAMNLFLPSMPDSSVETIEYSMNDAVEPMTRYLCNSCGFMFFIGNCGNINQQSNCPSCKNPIGTKQNKKIDNNPQKGTKQFQLFSEYGYLLYDIIGSNQKQQTLFRNNTPQSQVFMSFIIHSLILYQLCTQGSSFVNNKGETITIGHVWNVINHQWSILLSFNKNNQMLYHLFLSRLPEMSEIVNKQNSLYTKQGRLAFEITFTKSLATILENSEENIQQCLNIIESVNSNSLTKLELQISEHCKYKSEAEINQLLPNLFKVIEFTLSFDTFYKSFYNEIDNKSNHPLIDYILQNKQKLLLLEHLPNLISCFKYFARVFDHLLTKEESKNLTISNIKEKYFNNEEVFDEYVELFINCWSNIGQFITYHGCTKLQTISNIDRQFSVSFLIPSTIDEGRYFMGALEYLKNVQNKLLEYQLQFKNISIEGKELQKLNSDEIIHFQIDEDMLIGYNDMENGLEIIYDFNMIEKLFENQLIIGKKIILLENIENVHFKDELFSSTPNLISTLSEMLTQEPIDSQQLQNLEKILFDYQNIKEVFYFMEKLLWSVCKTNADPNESIQEYIFKWKIDVPISISHFVKSNFNQVKLRNLVSIFECVEICVCKIFVSTIPNIYKEKELNDEEISEIQTFYKNHSEKFPFLSILQKIICRYLISEKLTKNTPINYWCCNLDVWPLELLNYLNNNENNAKSIEKLNSWIDDPELLFNTEICMEKMYSLYILVESLSQPKLETKLQTPIIQKSLKITAKSLESKKAKHKKF